MVEMTTTKMTVEGLDVEVDMTVRGDDEDAANKVDTHAKDQLKRSMEALRDGKLPEDCEGYIMAVDWESVANPDDSDE